MADDYVGVAEPGTPNKKLATQTHAHGADTVHAEEVVLVNAAGDIVGVRLARLDAADTYTGGEELADQAGAGSVLTFTFADAMDLIWVRSVGDVSRASVNTVNPTATLGVYCADDEPTPIVQRATVVSVFAPAGATVSVWGMRYS